MYAMDYAMNVRCGCALWMYAMNVRCGCTLWMYAMNVRCGCALWMYSMNVLCGCALWIHTDFVFSDSQLNILETVRVKFVHLLTV